MIKFTGNGYGAYGFATLPDSDTNVYLFKLWTNVNRSPKQVYKIGITSAVDPYDRLRYNSIVDRVKICHLWENAELLACTKFKSRGAAKSFEYNLFKLVKPQDFIIESNISGKSEIRRWDQDEINQLLLQFTSN